MKVLSLFNGMGCIWLALDKAGIKVEKRYSSEIDKYANIVNQTNYPNTIQLGSVTEVKGSDIGHIDLLVGGSPCQGFSFAGKGLNFEDPRSKLFFEFVRIYHELKEINPKIKFLLENVKMKEEHELVISKLLDINPIEINSSLLSAQNRVRLYWTNIGCQPVGLFGDYQCTIPQPIDKGILLKHILQDNVDEKYYLSEAALKRVLGKDDFKAQFDPEKTGTINTKNNSGQLSVDNGTTLISVLNNYGQLRENESGKANCVDANYYKGMDNHSQRTMIVAMRGRNIVDGKRKDYNGAPTEQRLEPNTTGKTICLTSVQKDNLVREVIQVNKNKQSGGKQPYQQNRIYDSAGVAPALMAEISSGTHAILHNYRVRRLTEVECERLQTVPDNYTSHVSSTQRYKILGNGWTVNVISYILGFL